MYIYICTVFIRLQAADAALIRIVYSNSKSENSNKLVSPSLKDYFRTNAFKALINIIKT